MTALIVIGCVLAFEPVLSEAKEAMLKMQKRRDNGVVKNDKKEINPDDFDYAEFSDSDTEISTDETSIPWLLKRCLANLGVELELSEVSVFFILDTF